MSPKPLIVELKRNALDDGPGIRTTVFFKGCPLACVWCQNPEAISAGPEIMFSPRECIGCRACVEACPHGALDFSRPGFPIDTAGCRVCGSCVAVCPGKGMRLVGSYYSPEELARELERDLPFYQNSGGGVTLSGGEPTLFPNYLEQLLQILKFKRIHINLQTSGYYYRPLLEKKILPYLDLVHFDLKIYDDARHRQYTGRSNRLILDNFRSLWRKNRVPVLPRIPLVPGVTAVENNLKGISLFLKEMGVKKVELLPYNPLWISKAESMGKTLSYTHDSWMPEEEIREWKKLFNGMELL